MLSVYNNNIADDANNLKLTLQYVENIEFNIRAQAYKKLYNHIKIRQHTTRPAMLLLQRKIQNWPGTVLDEVKNEVDDNCKRIIERIAIGIETRDYSISNNIATIDSTLLDDNMLNIVREIITVENALLPIQYSMQLPISNRCFLIGALVDEMFSLQMLESELAMQVWAHTKYTMEEESEWSSVALSSKKVCEDALKKLSTQKEKFFPKYQKYVEDPDKTKIKRLHTSNPHVLSIVRPFVSSYYNGDATRAQNLLTSANAIAEYDAVGHILHELHLALDKNNQKNSFEAFRLFHIVKCKKDSYDFQSQSQEIKQIFEQLSGETPPCLKRLFSSEGITQGFSFYNKFHKNATLSIDKSGEKIVCFHLGHKRSIPKWKITIDQQTSLMTLKNEAWDLKLGSNNGLLYASLVEDNTSVWMVKSVSDHTFKIYCNVNGQQMILDFF
jgi:hypothetical protein